MNEDENGPFTFRRGVMHLVVRGYALSFGSALAPHLRRRTNSIDFITRLRKGCSLRILSFLGTRLGCIGCLLGSRTLRSGAYSCPYSCSILIPHFSSVYICWRFIVMKQQITRRVENPTAFLFCLICVIFSSQEVSRAAG